MDSTNETEENEFDEGEFDFTEEVEEMD